MAGRSRAAFHSNPHAAGSPARHAHWTARASSPVCLELVTTDVEAAHLKVVADPGDNAEHDLKEQVFDLLAEGRVLTRPNLRTSLAVKNECSGTVLESLEWAS